MKINCPHSYFALLIVTLIYFVVTYSHLFTSPRLRWWGKALWRCWMQGRATCSQPPPCLSRRAESPSSAISMTTALRR